MIALITSLKRFFESRKNHIRTLKYSKYRNINNVSILSNNCLAGLIYSDTHNVFLTPTINLSIDPLDFCKMINNFDCFKKGKLSEKPNKNGIPQGTIEYNGNSWNILFNHYKSYSEAFNKWNSRKNRISNNLFIIVNSRVLTQTLYDAFVMIPYDKLLICEKSDLNLNNRGDIIVNKLNAVKYLNIVSIKRGYNCLGLNIYKKTFKI